MGGVGGCGEVEDGVGEGVWELGGASRRYPVGLLKVVIELPSWLSLSSDSFAVCHVSKVFRGWTRSLVVVFLALWLLQVERTEAVG